MRTTTVWGGGTILMALTLAGAAGCGSSFDSDGEGGGAATAGSGGTAGTAGSAGSAGSAGKAGSGGNAGSAGVAGAGGASGSAGAAGGPIQEVSVLLRATTDTYPHNDGLASQTAAMVSAGVRSVELIDDSGESWVLFDGSPNAATVHYNDGDTTELARMLSSDVRPGHYVQGRLVQDWSRLTVVATMHELTGTTDGSLHILQVTSEGAIVDGILMAGGDYVHEFEWTGGTRTFEGNWPIPDHSATAEAEAFLENGDWVVYFPMDLDVSAGQEGKLEIEVNMDHAFRWTDMPTLGNTADVYDIAPPIYEPVEQFGGNRFVVRWLPWQ